MAGLEEGRESFLDVRDMEHIASHLKLTDARAGISVLQMGSPYLVVCWFGCLRLQPPSEPEKVIQPHFPAIEN
jgi:hypothetical protein